MRQLGVLVLAVAAAIGCGSGSGGTAGTVSCTISEAIGSGDAGLALMLCEETSGAEAQQLRQSCTASAGGADGGFSAQSQFANAPCSRVGAAGGCRITSSGVTLTAWYYMNGGFTSDLVSQACAMGGGTFVPP